MPKAAPPTSWPSIRAGFTARPTSAPTATLRRVTRGFHARLTFSVPVLSAQRAVVGGLGTVAVGRLDPIRVEGPRYVLEVLSCWPRTISGWLWQLVSAQP